jgi:6-phosphogluconate dehydrogenase
MKSLSDIGVIGLAVMGENLALNMESKGFTVSVYNRTIAGKEEGIVERFIDGRGKEKNFIGSTELIDFVKSIDRPRKVFIMVRAGKPVDELIEQLIPLLEKGDIIIDGGTVAQLMLKAKDCYILEQVFRVAKKVL